jgi:hypothetical protein
LNNLFHERVRIESAFVDHEPRTARRPYVPILHDKIAIRHDRIGPDHPEAENEFARWHDVLGWTTGVEVRAGGGFDLRKHGKAATIDLEIGRFGNRSDFPDRRYAPMQSLMQKTSAASAATKACASWIDPQASSAISGTPVAARLMAAMPSRSDRFTGCSR